MQQSLNNVYLINKPESFTSFDIVAKVRKHTNIRKTGHAGTLDPFATGLLIVCTGKFTRLMDFFHQYPKTYESRFKLGESSDTDDITGTISNKMDYSSIKESEIINSLKEMEGEILQQPPSISAKRVNGKRLYKANRNGEKLEAKPVSVTIHKIEIKNISLPFVDVEITCGTGTYIRSIARDLGEKLGNYCLCETLKRTKIGPYCLDNSIEITDDILTPIDHLEILPELDAITLTEDITKKLLKGNTVKTHDVKIDLTPKNEKIVRLFSPYFKNFIAICKISSYDKDNYNIKAIKVFNNEI